MTSKKHAGTSPSDFRIIQAGTEIRTIPEPDSADIAFMARQLVQATLPHSAPVGNPPLWVRRNGNLILSIRPGYTTDDTTGKPVCLGTLMVQFPGSFCSGLRPKLFGLEAGD